jgi:predicted HTH transcriptional regulator
MQGTLTLIKQGESQTVEFKISFQKEVIESAVAFTNTKG